MTIATISTIIALCFLAKVIARPRKKEIELPNLKLHRIEADINAQIREMQIQSRRRQDEISRKCQQEYLEEVFKIRAKMHGHPPTAPTSHTHE